MSSDFQEETIRVTDKFEVTGYSTKPFYKLTQEENQALDAKNNKNIIFFKATLIKADEPSAHRAIINGEWVRKHRDKWPALPITMGHPDFKKNVKMVGRPEEEIVKDILSFQERYAVGRIMKVDDHPTDKRLQNFYGYLDNPSLVKGIMNGETLMPRYGSPYFWHLGDIDRSSFDKDGNFLVNDHAPVHWAFVKSPAMGQEIEVHAMCTGSEMACLQKMQSNSIGDDSHWQGFIDDPNLKGITYTCPAAYVEHHIKDGLDKSFYVEDPLNFKMSSNSQESQTSNPDQDNTKKFMEGGKPNTGSMPPTNNKDGEGAPPNPGEQVDRNKADLNKEGDQNKEGETPEEKSKIDVMLEEVRTKEAKSQERKFSKIIQEKDAEIEKRDKIIGELQFTKKTEVINQFLPDDLFGGKEEDKKKAAEEREFYTKLAKEKNMSVEELTRILSRNVQVKELKVGIGSSKPNKGQANSAEASQEQIKAGIKEFTLSDKTTKTFVEDTKTTPDESKRIKEGVKNFLSKR